MTRIIEAGVDQLANDDRFCDWLREHNVVPENTYRVEIRDSSMCVYQFALTDEGRKYLEIVDGRPEPARRVLDVPIKSRPDWLADARPTPPTLIDSGATFSRCGRYRYTLWRRWDYSRPAVLFVMLNPSTADAEQDDPTIRRCIGFARRWGYGGVRICNLYAWRATNPRDLPAIDAVAERPRAFERPNRNDGAIMAAALDAGRIIVAWGAHIGPVSTRRAQVLKMLAARKVEALGLTKDGHPRHPLYVRGDVEPVPYGGTN